MSLVPIFDPTIKFKGLFETVEDLKNAPQIVTELLSIPLIREYIIEQREVIYLFLNNNNAGEINCYAWV
jgi:phosphoenolpyruvate carboxylase